MVQVHGECSTVITDYRPIPLHWSFGYSGEGEPQMVPFMTANNKQLNPGLTDPVYYEDSDSDDSFFFVKKGGRRYASSGGLGLIQILRVAANLTKSDHISTRV